MDRNNLRKIIIGPTAAGDNTIVVGGKLGAGIGSIRVWQLELNSTGANVITPKSNATVIPGQINHTGNGSATVLQNTQTPWWETLPGQSLILNFTNAGTTSGAIWYSLA